MKLLSVSSDAKTVKGEKHGYLTAILYLAPSTLSGKNVCPKASPGCIATCLNTAGMGVFSSVQQGRLRRTEFFWKDRDSFMAQLVRELNAFVRKAQARGMRPVVRLNGTSDIAWEHIPAREEGSERGSKAATWKNLMAAFPMVQFYDYTKLPQRVRRNALHNYHLTFSRSECNEPEALRLLSEGYNVTVVFSTRKGEPLPEWWNGYAVVDGDETDLRFNDAACSACARPFVMLSGGVKGCAVHGIRSALKGRAAVVGLRAKGKAKQDTSGFVVKVGAR